ncbi:hypothetical protein KFE26_17905 [Shewanella sp. M16]|uniref:hypothetical protein n=1 Tax=Shewanella sp. M16 TaxID=2830837 RepID=UPI001BAEE10D|nr:hypothetical protein [Shewanella sp. M16]MBS0044160.1 hypothetical protein [Shewanella sp. M16]
MNLIATHYDFIRKARPLVSKYATLDVELIRITNPDIETIHSVDDYEGSNFGQCVDEMEDEIFKAISESSNLPVEIVKEEIDNFPVEFKTPLISLFATINYEFHSLVNFELSGKKTFFFNDNLAEHLANTDINMMAEDIEIPFPSCLFVYTAESVINAIHNIRGVDGRMDMNADSIDYKAPVSVFITLHDVNHKNLRGRKLVINAFHSRYPNKSYQMIKRELYLGNGWTLEDSLRTNWEDLTPDDVCGGLNISGQLVNDQLSDEVFYQDGLLFFRIILNSILYLDSESAELEPVSSVRTEAEKRAKNIISRVKRKKKLNEVSSISYLDYLDVGRTVSPITIDKSKSSVESLTEQKSQRKLHRRFIVRGHWKLQAYGEKMSLRKRIRIAPYYRGQDVAVLINKPYLVK